MAPPTPVYNRSQIRNKYHDQLTNPDKYQCQLKSLTQHECTFKVSFDGRRPQEIICLPFKRIFQRCLVPETNLVNGKKVHLERWINIEVTDLSTNADLVLDSSKYGKDVQDFLSAEKEFKKLMESYEEASS